ncbi:hypothetical protein LINPERPRIM_LOCUS20919 [Linum perenne]
MFIVKLTTLQII